MVLFLWATEAFCIRCGVTGVFHGRYLTGVAPHSTRCFRLQRLIVTGRLIFGQFATLRVSVRPSKRAQNNGHAYLF